MSKRATPRTRTPLTAGPSRAVRDAQVGRNKLAFGLALGMSVPPPVVVFWLTALNNRLVISREGSYGFAEALNTIVHQALALPRATWDYLVWLEADHTFNYVEVFGYLERLDPKKHPVVGCLYVERAMPCLPVGFDRDDEGKFVRWGEERMLEFERRPGLHPVTGGVPTGVTAVHRSVFERLAARGVDWYHDPSDGSMSADIWFCQQAIAAGFPIHVETRFDIGHWGSARYDRRHYWAARELDRAKLPLLAEETIARRARSMEPTPAAPPPVPAVEQGNEVPSDYTYRERRSARA